MPAPLHIKVTWTGVIGTPAAPVEIWSMGLAFDPLGAFDTTPENYQQMADSLALPFQNNIAPRMSSQAVLTRVRVARVEANGRVGKNLQGAFTQYDKNIVSAGLGSGTPPFQVALAISTQSVVSGATGRGRFYIPLPELGVLDFGRISASTQSAYLSAAQFFLNDCNAVAKAQNVGPAAIASGGAPLQGLPPRMNIIRSVRVGRVPDTIRSRRSELDEAYTSAAVA